MILTGPPQSLQVAMSMSPKAPTVGEHALQALRPGYCHGRHVCRFCRSKNRPWRPGVRPALGHPPYWPSCPCRVWKASPAHDAHCWGQTRREIDTAVAKIATIRPREASGAIWLIQSSLVMNNPIAPAPLKNRSTNQTLTMGNTGNNSNVVTTIPMHASNMRTSPMRASTRAYNGAKRSAAMPGAAAMKPITVSLVPHDSSTRLTNGIVSPNVTPNIAAVRIIAAKLLTWLEVMVGKMRRWGLPLALEGAPRVSQQRKRVFRRRALK